jgi:hypothetical protein
MRISLFYFVWAGLEDGDLPVAGITGVSRLIQSDDLKNQLLMNQLILPHRVFVYPGVWIPTP